MSENQTETVPTFVLSVPALVAGIEDLAQLDAKIGESVGTMGKIMAEAKTVVHEHEMLDEEVQEAITALASPVDPPTWGDLTVQLDLLRSIVQAKFDEAVQTQAGDTIRAHRTNIEALQSVRASRYAAIKAMHEILSQAGPAAFPGIDRVTLPSATGSNRGRPVGVKNGEGRSSKPKMEVYRVGDDGKLHFLAKGSPLNLVAFRWFGQCGIDALQSACEQAGIDTSQPWEPTEVTVVHEGVEYTHKIGGQLPGNPIQ